MTRPTNTNKAQKQGSEAATRAAAAAMALAGSWRQATGFPIEDAPSKHLRKWRLVPNSRAPAREGIVEKGGREAVLLAD